VTPPTLDPTLVRDAGGLARLAERIAGEPAVALDTESNSFHAYRERVCLIQVSIPDEDFVVDPLAVDVRPLGELLVAGREIVLHGADYDVRCLKREFGWSLGSLFDTMVAARRLGAAELGLAALVRAHFGVRLEKVHQRADWGRRPLAPELVRYAALDTHFLLGLRGRLVAELEGQGLAVQASRDFARIAASAPHERVFDPEGWRRLRGARQLDAAGAARLRALWLLREERARAADRPPFKVLGEDAMVEVARRDPATRADLGRIPGVTPRVLDKMGDEMLQAIRSPPEAPPRG
jgi:ribonuclease D